MLDLGSNTARDMLPYFTYYFRDLCDPSLHKLGIFWALGTRRQWPNRREYRGAVNVYFRPPRWWREPIEQTAAERWTGREYVIKWDWPRLALYVRSPCGIYWRWGSKHAGDL